MENHRLSSRAAAMALLTGIAAACGQRTESRSTGSGGLAGGGSVDGVAHECIPLWERIRAAAAIGAYVHRFGAISRPGPDDTGLYRFYPQGCNLYDDVPINNWVDLDPSAGLQTYSCAAYTYNGHLGIDSDLRWSAEQLIGVPI